MGLPLKERFVKRVELIPFSDCHIWTGATAAGYGHIGHQGKNLLTHRLAWEWANERSAEGTFVLHKCDVRCCVNPAHLFVGDARLNALDMISKGRHNSQRSDSYTKKNTRVVDGRREQRCTQCAEWFPETPAYWHSGEKATSKLSYQCKRCRNPQIAAWRKGGVVLKPRPLEARKQSCIHGHPFVEDNIYWHRGRRNCLACCRAAAQRYRDKGKSI